MTSSVFLTMAPWTTVKFRLSCMDNHGLKRALLKMLIIENNSSKNNDLDNEQNVPHECMADVKVTNSKSLLQFFAFNALELSAPASPVLLEHNTLAIPSGWLQLAGHPQSIAPMGNGVVRKRIKCPEDLEAQAYRLLSLEQAAKIVPKFLGISNEDADHYIELQNLLNGFEDPYVMDIKIGTRTFLESEVTNTTIREDLYQKMIAVDPNAPTEEEHKKRGITKLRYMTFREHMSSSHDKGFRIEAIKLRGSDVVTNLKKVKSDKEILNTVASFVNGKKKTTKEILKRLKQMRLVIEKSIFFHKHEVVGSSIFMIYDDNKTSAWLIDFAKSKPIPKGIKVNHRAKWIPGNYEEGLLFGFDEVIRSFENVYHKCSR